MVDGFKIYDLKIEIESLLNIFAINADTFDFNTFMQVDEKETKTSKIIMPAGQ